MKHLKPFLAILLSLVLLVSVCSALAEELPYMQQLSQDVYMSTSLLTTESYPEACISPYYFSAAYISQYKEPYFIRFACPPNTFVASFNEYSCSFIDMTYNRQYAYIGQDGYSYENFLNKCEVDEYILADGSDGKAIYINPENSRAFALISAAEIDKSAKLEIRIYDNSLRNQSEQQCIDSLTAQITEEVARVQATMTTEKMDNYWTDGRYAGIHVICNARNSGDAVMTYTLPEGYFITNVDSEDVSIAKLESKGNAITVDFDLDTYSYVDYQVEEDPDHVTTLTVDGTDYRIYSHWYNDEKILTAYVDTVISTTAGYNGDETLYLTIKLSPEGDFQWTSLADMEAELTRVASGAKINFGQDVTDYRSASPYVATEVSAPAVQAAEGGWTCSSCGTENGDGNFCSNCGAARETEITCSNCGFVVPEGETPKFCSNCGNPF